MTRGGLSLLVLVAACGDNLTPNRAPIAEPFSLTTQEDLSVTRTIDVTDLDNDELETAVPIPPDHGTVTLDGLSITYQPAPDYHGADQFAIVISDVDADVSLTVDVTVTAVNDPPIGVADTLATSEDTALTVAASLLMQNDSDADVATDGQVIAITAVDSATNGTVALVGTNITFTPTADFTGNGSFTYTLSDGIESSQVPVTVEIGGANDVPDAVDDSFTTAEDTPITITQAQLLANDTDPENQVLDVTSVSGGTNGTVVDNGDDTYTFTPAADFNGDATFEYTISDGVDTDTATVTIAVTPVNDPPIANDDAVSQGGAPNAIPHATLLANDSDGGDGGALVIESVQDAVNGNVTLEANTVTFTPNANFVGTASFTYTINDGASETDTATVTVTITAARVCGDSVITAPEECDDGDDDPGDGCDASCEVEDGFECAGEPSICVTVCGDGIETPDEACDDGDADELDGCTTECVVGRVCDDTEFPGGDRFVVDPATGHCYVSFDGTSTTFAVAQASCLASGGYLATITSSAENSVFVTVLDPAENPWIGARDIGSDTDDVFDWITDEPFSFKNYAPGQPDDDAGQGGTGECLHVFNAAGEWNDTNCNLTTFVTGQVCEYEPSSCGDSLIQPGEECDDSNNTDGDGCSAICKTEGLFFSEYVEGTGNNKALEIKNPSSSIQANLTSCFLRVDFSDGNQAVATLPPLNFLPPNDVVVICNPLADPAILANCDLPLASATMNFDGDDTVALVCGSTVVDVIGDVGFDPGTEWGTGLTSTADNTLRRKCGVSHGDPTQTDDFEPTLAAEWVGFATDTFDGLGSTACAP